MLSPRHHNRCDHLEKRESTDLTKSKRCPPKRVLRCECLPYLCSLNLFFPILRQHDLASVYRHAEDIGIASSHNETSSTSHHNQCELPEKRVNRLIFQLKIPGR
jgi:hypothetical protein